MYIIFSVVELGSYPGLFPKDLPSARRVLFLSSQKTGSECLNSQTARFLSLSWEENTSANTFITIGQRYHYCEVGL